MGSWPWPWPRIGSYCIPSCITRRPLPTHEISLKSKNFFVDGRTYGWTDIWDPLMLLGWLWGVDLKMHQNPISAGVLTRPCWESLQHSPDPLARFMGPTSKTSMHFKRERRQASALSASSSEKTSDLVWTSDSHESGEATKPGHELDAAGQKRMRQTSDDLKANHLTRPQWPGHVIRGGRSCSTWPDQMEEQTVRLMRHSAQEDISISKYF